MTPKWMSHLVQARQSQEDAAAQRLAFARRAQSRARGQVDADKSRLDARAERHPAESLDAVAFVASAVALQSVAATWAASLGEADRADEWVIHREHDFTAAAVSRLTAERLRENAQNESDAVVAREAARDMDETAATGHERRRREDGAS